MERLVELLIYAAVASTVRVVVDKLLGVEVKSPSSARHLVHDLLTLLAGAGIVAILWQ